VFRLAAVLLITEAVLASSRLARLVTGPAFQDPVVLTMVAARAGVLMWQIAAGLMLIRRLPPSVGFVAGACVASALLLVLEIGVGLSPSSVFPAHRWPLVTAYAVYAGALVLALRQAARRSRIP
jgi:hypothetical protein